MTLFRFGLTTLCCLCLSGTIAFAQQAVKDDFCRVGSRVFVDPGHHPATVLDRTAVSCRVHYEDGKYPDGWVQGFMVKSADAEDKSAAAAKTAPPNGKYSCGIFLGGRFTFTQSVTLSNGAYDSSSAGSGHYHYDPASKRLLFDTGKFQPLFGSYEPQPGYPMFRLSARTDSKESDYTRSWRSQVCSGKY